MKRVITIVFVLVAVLAFAGVAGAQSNGGINPLGHTMYSW